MKHISEKITEIGIRLLDETNEVSPKDLKDAVVGENDELVEKFSRLLAEQKILTLCKKWLSTTSAPVKESKLSQMLLVGDPPPNTVTINGDGKHEFKYVRTDKATRTHAYQYLNIINKNIADAQQKADDWQDKLTQLQEAWDVDPALNISDALNLLLNQKVQAAETVN